MSKQGQEELDLITEAEAARILNVSRGCLRQWRFRKKGPEFIKLEGTIRYSRRAILTFVADSQREVR